MAGNAACQQVFGNEYLVEMCLDGLPIVDLCAASAVSKSFRQTIANSRKLQQQLFQQPIRTSTLRPNREFADAGYCRKHGCYRCPPDGHDPAAAWPMLPDGGAYQKCLMDVTNPPFRGQLLKYYVPNPLVTVPEGKESVLNWSFDLNPLLEGIKMRPLWRNMFLTQPPIDAIELAITCSHRTERIVVVRRPNGVRLGDIWMEAKAECASVLNTKPIPDSMKAKPWFLPWCLQDGLTSIALHSDDCDGLVRDLSHSLEARPRFDHKRLVKQYTRFRMLTDSTNGA